MIDSKINNKFTLIIVTIISFFLFMNNVNAKDTCNQDDISIDSIELKELSDNTRV